VGFACAQRRTFRPGVYRTGSGFIMKKVRPDFFVPHAKEGGLYVSYFATNENRNLIFFGASPTPVKERALTGIAPVRQGRNIFPQALEKNLTASPEINKDHFEVERQVDADGRDAYRVSLVAEGKRQVIGPVAGYSENLPVELIWRGDLDGDGRDDYLLRFGDKASQPILYLSTKARPGELVRPVAVFRSGYCC
jgi:hypothetical protein